MNECFVQRILIFLFFPLCFEKLTPWLGFCLLPCSECARARPESRQAVRVCFGRLRDSGGAQLALVHSKDCFSVSAGSGRLGKASRLSATELPLSHHSN